MLDYIALGMVLVKAQTGYDIKKDIERGVGNFYKASYGSLYPALKKLTEKGYLNMVEQRYGNRLKKSYIATELGKAAFLKWLSSSFDVNASSESLIARVYFFGELPRDTRNSLLQEYELYSHEMLKKLQEIEKQFPHHINNDRDYFELSTLYFGLQNMYSALQWFRHIRQEKPLKEFLQKYDI